jgi:hypothetical protein
VPAQHTIQSSRSPVPSATRAATEHTVTEDPITGERTCNCEANDHPKTRGRCWHLKAVAAGLAGKLRVRVTQSSGFSVQTPAPAPLPTVRRARTSAEGLAFASSLDV